MEKLLTLFLSALGVQDHLLLSLDKTDRFSKLLCSRTQCYKFWRDGRRRCCRWCRWCNGKWGFWSWTAWFVRFLVGAKLWRGLDCRLWRSIRRKRRCFSQWWRVKGARWVRRARQWCRWSSRCRWWSWSRMPCSWSCGCRRSSESRWSGVHYGGFRNHGCGHCRHEVGRWYRLRSCGQWCEWQRWCCWGRRHERRGRRPCRMQWRRMSK